MVETLRQKLIRVQTEDPVPRERSRDSAIQKENLIRP